MTEPRHLAEIVDEVMDSTALPCELRVLVTVDELRPGDVLRVGGSGMHESSSGVCVLPWRVKRGIFLGEFEPVMVQLELIA